VCVCVCVCVCYQDNKQLSFCTEITLISRAILILSKWFTNYE